jgi:hypothetical protein
VANDVALAIKRVSDAVTRLHNAWMRRGQTSDGLAEAIQEFDDAQTTLNEALWEARDEPDN